MCNCVNVPVGSHAAAVELPTPGHMLGFASGCYTAGPTVCVDACLVDEVRRLWAHGIRTTGCCCGHNAVPPYIGVADEDIPRMKAMGYAVAPNPCRPGDEDAFVPFSVPSPAPRLRS